MTLFLLLSIPIWFLLVVSFHNSRDWMGILRFFLGGLFIGMLALLITLGLLTRAPFRMDSPGLYWWAWIRGTGLPMLLAVPIVFIASNRNSNPYSRIPDIAACLSGVVILYNAWYGITRDSGFLVYRIFISPIIWIGTIALITWLLDRGLHWNGPPRYLFLAASISLPSIINFLPLIHINNGHYLTWIISVAFAIVASLLVFFNSRA